MPSTYSPSLKLELIGNGEQTNTWGDTTNNNLGTLIEQAITGVGSITLTGDYTLTNYNGLSDDARNAVLIFNGALANAANVYAPTVEKTYIVVNKSGANVTIKTSIGNGITLTNNTSQLVYCDNTNFYTALNVNSVTGDMTVTGNESVGGTFTVGGQVTFNGNLISLTNTLSFTSSTGIIDASANTGALVPPTGATSDRPASPSLGTARWNTTLGWYEIWNGSTWVSITGTYSVSYLVVAGGGGGPGVGAGGGGAGGLLANTTTVSAGTAYSIVVGSGGSYGDGSNSTALSRTAVGGGGGGSAPGVNGRNGGSGGGGHSWGTPAPSGGSGVSGQGYAGGSGNGGDNNFGAGGGGGAGAVGSNGTGSGGGNGGTGVQSSISGTATYYAGGGGGAADVNGGNGGAGGGGGASGSQNGTANTGGGGAGYFGIGGSGVVVISYTASYQRGSGGNVTSYTSGGNTYYVHTFTTSGTFTA